MKVFNDVSANLLAQIAQPTASCLHSTVSNLTAACLQSEVSNLTAACLQSQVSNLTAACLLSEVSNLTAACLQSQVSNLTAACLLSEVSNLTAACLQSQVSNLTAACLQTESTLASRMAQVAVEDVSATSTIFNNATSQYIGQYFQHNFLVYNSSADYTALVRLMVSADGNLFINDNGTPTITLGTGTGTILTPGVYANYAAVAYAAVTSGNTASISIYYQGQA
ncbi:MAG: DUF6385 domain-containing protein [Heliobacteriaceae bacterium]|nr:DUF6385 domain-containing protein [Heliobacteriaceae bacterium]